MPLIAPMIHIKHPEAKCNASQESFVTSAPVEERRFHELFFTIGNATIIYHNRAKDFEPYEADYLEWLGGLPEKVRAGMEEKGFKECRSILSFTRYVMEKNDIGQEEFVRNLVGKAIYDEYLQICMK